MSIADIKKEIIKEVMEITEKIDCPYCEIGVGCPDVMSKINYDICAVVYLIDRLATSEEKVRQLSQLIKSDKE